MTKKKVQGSKQVPESVKIEEPKEGKNVALDTESASVLSDVIDLEPEIITVVGIKKAEDLQKSGYRNIATTKIGTDKMGMTIKEYKFIKE